MIKIGEIYQIEFRDTDTVLFMRLKRDQDGKAIGNLKNQASTSCKEGDLVVAIKKSIPTKSLKSHLVFSFVNGDFFFINDEYLKKIEQ